MRILKPLVSGSLLIATVCMIIFGCKKDAAPVTPPDKSRLKSVLDSVTLVYNSSTEGTRPGFYTIGSKAALREAIDVALSVNGGSVFIQEDVEFAISNLRSKYQDFLNKRIPEIAFANLVAQWKFDGNANDTTGHQHTGLLGTGWTDVNGSAGVDGATLPVLTADRFNRAGMAYDFDKGANITVPYDTSLNPKMLTISLWVKARGAGSNRVLFSLNRQNGYKFQLENNFLQFSYNADNGLHDVPDNTTAVAADAWVHTAVSYTNGTLKFYQNGVLLKTVSVSGTPVTLSSPVNLVIGNELPKNLYTFGGGAYPFATASYFVGSLDDVRLYNRVLTDAEITSIYNVERIP